MSENGLMEPILLRYEGIDAAEHEIELASFGESLIGMSRIVAVSSNFVITGDYKFNYQSHQVKVVTREPKAKCFELLLYIKAVSQHPIFQGFAGPLVAAIIGYIIARKSKESRETEKRILAIEELVRANGYTNEKVVLKMLSLIEKMSDDLHPALKQVVAPVNITCETIQIGKSEYEPLLINANRKAKILEESPIEIEDEASFSVVISELDKENATCKVRFTLPKEEKRVPALIADPSVKIMDDPYSLAMACASVVKVTGKLEYQDGEIKKLHILNIHS
jgi:hypothetical protein